MLDRDDEYRKMAECERDHWWYRNLHERCIEAIEALAGRPPLRVLDAACGTGGLLLKLRQHGPYELRGFDLSPAAVSRARACGLDVIEADLRDVGRVFPGEVFDVIVSNDSLYFLDEPEQQAFVQACRGRLRAGGLLIMNLPARAAFAGMHDRAVGIGRRFETGDVARLASAGPWAVVQCRGWPLALSPLILAARGWQRWRMRRGGREIKSDVAMPPRWANAVLYGLTRAERRWPGPGYGSSIFLVLRRC
jgi:SAM-dependent methyltransferase